MILTQRLRLRPWRLDERDAFAALVNTPAMTARLGGTMDEGRVDTLFRRRLDDQARDGMSYWAVERLADGVLIGSCGLRRADDYARTPVAGMIEAGWRIATRWQGQGHAVEAAAAAMAWGWANTSVDAIGAWTTAANTASLAVMRRLGMIPRPDLAFHHPRHAPGDPLGAMLVHVVERTR